MAIVWGSVLTVECALSLRKWQKSKMAHPGFFLGCRFEAPPKLMWSLSSHEGSNLPVWALLFVGIVVLHKYTSILPCVYVTLVKWSVNLFFELMLRRQGDSRLNYFHSSNAFRPLYLVLILFLFFSEESPRDFFPHRLLSNIIFIVFIINSHIFQPRNGRKSSWHVHGIQSKSEPS